MTVLSVLGTLAFCYVITRVAFAAARRAERREPPQGALLDAQLLKVFLEVEEARRDPVLVEQARWRVARSRRARQGPRPKRPGDGRPAGN